MKKLKRIKNAELKEFVYAAQSPIHGKGVFAAKNIAKGDYIGSYHGPVAKRNGTYVLWVYDPDAPDEATGISGKNTLRFLNHAKKCNAEFEGVDLYAKKRIKKDDEVTFDYGPEFFVD